AGLIIAFVQLPYIADLWAGGSHAAEDSRDCRRSRFAPRLSSKHATVEISNWKLRYLRSWPVAKAHRLGEAYCGLVAIPFRFVIVPGGHRRPKPFCGVVHALGALQGFLVIFCF